MFPKRKVLQIFLLIIVPALRSLIIIHLATRAGIFKPLWRPGIDAKASIPPAYVAWRAGTITLFLLGA
jgi:hypothetical protein